VAGRSGAGFLGHDRYSTLGAFGHDGHCDGRRGSAASPSGFTLRSPQQRPILTRYSATWCRKVWFEPRNAAVLEVT
jgi:hypothetical protein